MGIENFNLGEIEVTKTPDQARPEEEESEEEKPGRKAEERKLERIYFDREGNLNNGEVEKEFGKYNTKLLECKSGDLGFGYLGGFPQDRDEYFRNWLYYKEHNEFPRDEKGEPTFESYEKFVEAFHLDASIGSVEHPESITELSQKFGVDEKELREVLGVEADQNFIILQQEIDQKSRNTFVMHEMSHLGEETVILEKIKNTFSSFTERSKIRHIYEVLTDIVALSLIPEQSLQKKDFEGYLGELSLEDLVYLKKQISDSEVRNAKEVLGFLGEEINGNSEIQEILFKQFKEKMTPKEMEEKFNWVLDELSKLPKYKEEI